MGKFKIQLERIDTLNHYDSISIEMARPEPHNPGDFDQDFV